MLFVDTTAQAVAVDRITGSVFAAGRSSTMRDLYGDKLLDDGGASANAVVWKLSGEGTTLWVGSSSAVPAPQGL